MTHTSSLRSAIQWSTRCMATTPVGPTVKMRMAWSRSFRIE